MAGDCQSCFFIRTLGSAESLTGRNCSRGQAPRPCCTKSTHNTAALRLSNGHNDPSQRQDKTHLPETLLSRHLPASRWLAKAGQAPVLPLFEAHFFRKPHQETVKSPGHLQFYTLTGAETESQRIFQEKHNTE